MAGTLAGAAWASLHCWGPGGLLPDVVVQCGGRRAALVDVMQCPVGPSWSSSYSGHVHCGRQRHWLVPPVPFCTVVPQGGDRLAYQWCCKLFEAQLVPRVCVLAAFRHWLSPSWGSVLLLLHLAALRRWLSPSWGSLLLLLWLLLAAFCRWLPPSGEVSCCCCGCVWQC